MKERLFATILVATILLQHFQLTAIAGYPITIGLLAGLTLVIAAARSKPTGVLLKTGILITAVSSVVAISEGTYVVGQDFFRTLTLVLTTASIIALGFHAPRNQLLRAEAVQRGLLLALCAVVALSVLQTVTGMAGSVQFFNVFGAHQYLYEYQPFLQFNPTPRAQGFFLEPSYNAFVIGTITILILASGRRRSRALLLCAAGMFVTQSATGLVLMGILLIVSAATRGITRLMLSILGFGVMYWLVGTYVFGRIASVSTSGTSANYRIQAPLTVLSDVLQHHIIGLPLGSIFKVMGTYNLANGTTRGTSLDNGFYVIVFYFGWVGVILLLALMTLALRSAYDMRIQSPSSSMKFLVPLWLIGTLLFSGGIMLPEFGIMTWLVLAMYNTKPTGIEYSKERHEIASTAPQHYHRHAQ